MEGKKIFQVVGFQNSGKTTLIKELIKACKDKGIAVGTIKHHGHGGTPERPMINKDSEQHRLAGAKITAVEGDGTLHIEAMKDQWELENIIEIYQGLPIDVILVEGYKQVPYPKVVLLRNEQEEFLLDELTNITAVISWKPLSKGNRAVPLFSIEETESFVYWFINKINED